MTALPSKLGPYTVDRELGRGGMGVVYLGHDTRLDRKVAVKALPEHLGQDPERLARFEREARTLAQLNHPNVAGIYGVEEVDGARYLVLEYVEGESLAQRLERGPVETGEALELCLQIASGIEAAHEAGVIHRDLKPGNVMVSPDHKAKILDFGLSRAERVSDSTNSQLVTATSPAPMTREGVALGTPSYMSPEQTSGRSVDRRSDIWAFGCVLYEMLTGRRAFGGNSSAEIASAILRDQPDLQRLPPTVPSVIVRLLGRCLTKDPQRRLRDIGDARFELEEALGALGSSSIGLSRPARGGGRSALWRSRRTAAVLGLGVLIGGAIVWAWILQRPQMRSDADPTHLSILVPHPPSDYGYFIPTFTCSRDGRQMLFVSAGQNEQRRLLVRSLDEPEEREIVVTTEMIETGVFSPDGRWVAYVTNDGWLRRVSVDGGPAEEICRAIRAPGLVWTKDDRIIFASYDDGRPRMVPASGGEPTVIDIPIEDGVSVIWPSLARDGTVLLYACLRQDRSGTSLWVEAYDLATGQRRRLIEDATYPRVIDSGHLLFQRGSTLMAIEFDESQAEVSGTARPMLNTMPMPHVGAAAWDVSENGTLFYQAEGALDDTVLSRVNRAGSATPLTSQRPFLSHLIQRIHLDSSGRKIVCVLMQDSLNGRIGVFDLDRDVLSVLPREHGSHAGPIWSADGNWIYYGQYQTGTIQASGVFRRRADGTGAPELVLKEPAGVICEDISSDGRWLLLSVNDGPHALEDGRDVGIVDLSQDPPVFEKLTESRYDEWSARFSPDGEWIAYISNESGIDQIFVRPVSTEAGRVQISRNGGVSPVWSADGREIYFGDPSASLVMATTFELTTRPDSGADSGSMRATIGAPRALVPARSSRFIEDVFPDGEGFLMIDAISETGPNATKIDVILNFVDMLAVE